MSEIMPTNCPMCGKDRNVCNGLMCDGAACGEGDTAQATEQPQTASPEREPLQQLLYVAKEACVALGECVPSLNLYEAIRNFEKSQPDAAPLRARIAELEQELQQWHGKIRPYEDLLNAFADQMHMQYVSFASDKGTYAHRMDVIKSAMMAFVKVAIIRAEAAEQKVTELEGDAESNERIIGNALAYLQRILNAVVPNVHPLPTLVGRCTQLDNFIAGLAQQVATLTQERDTAVKRMAGDAERIATLEQALKEFAALKYQLSSGIRMLARTHGLKVPDLMALEWLVGELAERALASTRGGQQ